MRHAATLLLVKLLRAYPIIYNIQVLVLIVLFQFKIDISNWIYDITGASLYMVAICFIASYIFHFCTWYRILCISSALSLILEWIDVNIVSVPFYIYIVQVIVIVAIFTALIMYFYEQRINKRNNQITKKID